MRALSHLDEFIVVSLQSARVGTWLSGVPGGKPWMWKGVDTIGINTRCANANRGAWFRSGASSACP